MDIPRCTDVSRPFPTPESRACILVGQTQEVTLLKTGKNSSRQFIGEDKRLCLALLANTASHAKALHQSLLYIEGIGNPSLTADPTRGTDGRISIIEIHKFDDPTRPFNPEHTVVLKIQTPKTKTAQPFSGAAPFSAIK
ncbi:hypothetical protein [Pseudomonas sp. B21-048]|uniref:hypothetical protein n=1 Tax=Pseudomonas sp. B21-048 TaxID=2895490 RepID=UPI00215F6A8C|nr:hypothetical protein [Pseudomonas sp. B21-048]UVK97217.1 hypothetical protein LOY56_17900 [Pseudomonas sp. B21-048]